MPCTCDADMRASMPCIMTSYASNVCPAHGCMRDNNDMSHETKIQCYFALSIKWCVFQLQKQIRSAPFSDNQFVQKHNSSMISSNKNQHTEQQHESYQIIFIICRQTSRNKKSTYWATSRDLSKYLQIL